MKNIGLRSLMATNVTWREMFIRFALFLFCLTIWRNEINLLALLILSLTWIVDGGLRKLEQMIKEPLVLAILVLCALLLLGLFWGDFPDDGRLKWKKYFIMLAFIPFLSLLNKRRLPWVLSALLVGYFSVFLIGIYQWTILGEPGVSLFRMSYLSFSAMLGIGVIVTVYLAGISKTKSAKIIFLLFALMLLFVQFNQDGRSLLLATLITLLFLILLLYRAEIRKFLTILVSLMVVMCVFALSSPSLQDRFVHIKHDFAHFQQGNYGTSLGYRLAIWDVGLNGIAEQPLFGHGTGAPERYFEDTVETYKEGIYKDLPKLVRTSHYHNDWIEIGMHLGLLGIFALAFLLWSWYQSFRVHQLPVLGAVLVCYIFLAGLTDTFIIYSRIPVMLLVITAIAICWQKENRNSCI